MANNRVEKYKEYRSSFDRMEEKSKKANFSGENDNFNTTTRIAFDKIVSGVEQSEQIEKMQLAQKKNIQLKYVIIGIGVLILIALFVLIGVNLWR